MQTKLLRIFRQSISSQYSGSEYILSQRNEAFNSDYILEHLIDFFLFNFRSNCINLIKRNRSVFVIILLKKFKIPRIQIETLLKSLD